MATIIEPTKIRALPSAKKFAPLKTFSCGRQGRPWEKSVNDWARNMYLGARPADTMVVLEDAARNLIGICGFRAEAVPMKFALGKPMKQAQCIHMIGIDR